MVLQKGPCRVLTSASPAGEAPDGSMAAESHHSSPGKAANRRAAEDAQQFTAGVKHVAAALSCLNIAVSQSSTSVPLLTGP